MSTISKANVSSLEDAICQGDIFKNIKYSYIESEDDNTVNIIEYEFPYAVIISQACDVIAMESIILNQCGKPTKFMPSILLCPIYDKNMAKKGEHIADIFRQLALKIDPEDVYQKDDYKVATRDWHYRFHALTVQVNEKLVIEDAIIDFKHYVSLPMQYLVTHKSDRILHLDDLFAEQLTLKFATYLSRVAIP